MVTVLVSGSIYPGSIPGQGHYVGHCFLGQDILLIQCLFISEFNSGGNPVIGWHLIQGGVKILLVHSSYWNRHLAHIQTFTVLYAFE